MRAKLRVLLDVSAVPARPVGAGVYTLALADRLHDHERVDLHLLARRGDAERWRARTPGATLHAAAPDRRPLRLAWEQTSAPRLARTVQPAVWHGPHYTLPLRVPVPAVVTVHDLTFFDHPEWHERSKVTYFRAMMRAAVEKAAVVVCVSQFSADRLRARLRVRDDAVVVIPHGVDHERFSVAARGDRDDLQALARHGVTPPYVAFAGTVEPRKDIPTLVHAFGRVASAHPDLRLVLAGGSGWGDRAARDAVTASGAAARIIRPGYIDDTTLAALFRQAEIVAYPSREEGFGLPALEAMACGTPLVSSKGSALEEVVGDAGVLVPPGDVEALADALRSRKKRLPSSRKSSLRRDWPTRSWSRKRPRNPASRSRRPA